jgi:hypothetical protein
VTNWADIVTVVRDLGGLGVAVAAITVLRRELHDLRATVGALVEELRRGRMLCRGRRSRGMPPSPAGARG